MTGPKIKLTYFDIEGRGEPVRLALILSKTPFEDDRVKFPQWKDMKPKTPHGQLPIMTIDDGPVMTQSMAMIRYVGETFSSTLYPKEKRFAIEEAIGLINDMDASWSPRLYISMRPTAFGHPEGYGQTEEGKKKVAELRTSWGKEELPRFLGYLEALLGNHNYLVEGDEPTLADCVAVPLLRSFTRGHIDYLPTSCLDGHPKIVQYLKNFSSHELIKGRYTDGVF